MIGKDVMVVLPLIRWNTWLCSWALCCVSLRNTFTAASTTAPLACRRRSSNRFCSGMVSVDQTGGG